MRASEFVNESVEANHISGKFRIPIDSHFFDRVAQRKISRDAVSDLLNDIVSVSNDIDQVDIGQQFYVVDPSKKVSLGFRKIKDRLIKLYTVVPTGNPITRSGHVVIKLK